MINNNGGNTMSQQVHDKQFYIYLIKKYENNQKFAEYISNTIEWDGDYYDGYYDRNEDTIIENLTTWILEEEFGENYSNTFELECGMCAKTIYNTQLEEEAEIAKEQAEFERDPLGYYGMRQSDFI